jgi:hypothetical protein
MEIRRALTLLNQQSLKKKCHVEMIERFNSGLGLIHKASLNLDGLKNSLPSLIFWGTSGELSKRFMRFVVLGLVLSYADEYAVQLEENLEFA